MVSIGTNGNITPPVEAVLKGAQRAETSGYDSVWWPDHLMGFHPQTLWTPDVTGLAEAIGSPHVFVDAVAAMAACAVHTERVLLGTAVTEPIRRHPAMLAQEFLTLDHFSKGRAVLGLGAGERENIEPYGMDFSMPVGRLEEAITVIRLLWENVDPVDFEGEHWHLKDAVCGMPPYPHPDTEAVHYPPIWVGAHGPRMLDITGRLADGWLPMYRGGVEPWSDGWRTIQAAARDAGRELDAFTPGLLAHIVVDEDDAAVEQLLESPLIRAWMLTMPSQAFEQSGYEHPLGSGVYGLLDYVPTRLSREDAWKAVEKVPVEVARTYLVCGTPDIVTDELKRFTSAGMEHLIVWNLTYLGDPNKMRTSFALLNEIADEVRRSG